MDCGSPQPGSGGTEVPADSLRRTVSVPPGRVAGPPARDSGHLARLHPAGDSHCDGLLAGPPRRFSRGDSQTPTNPRPSHAHGRPGHPGPHDDWRVLRRRTHCEYETSTPRVLGGGRPLCATEHRRVASAGSREAKEQQRHANEGKLAAILERSRPMEKRRILRSAKTGAWLSTLPSLLNGSDLSAEEFQDGWKGKRLEVTANLLGRFCWCLQPRWEGLERYSHFASNGARGKARVGQRH